MGRDGGQGLKRAIFVVAGLILGSYTAWKAATTLDQPSLFTVGLDMRIIVWAPTHGLMSGFNPYEASNAYLSAFGLAVPATLHAPSLLLLTAPFAVNDVAMAFAGMTVASVVVLWLAIPLVVRLDTWAHTMSAVLLGCLLTFTGPAQEALLLGQVTSVAVLGLALVVRQQPPWAVVIGIALLSTSPQFALPFSILLLGLGYRRTVVYGWALSFVASLPVLMWAAANAGGVQPLLRSLLLSLEASNNAGNTLNRVDLSGAFLNGDSRTSIIFLVATAATSVWLHRRGITMSPTTALVATAWCLLATYSMPYSLLLVLLVSVPVLLEKPWATMEWFTVGIIVLCVAASPPISTRVADVARIGTGQVWAVLTVAYGVLLIGVVVSGAIRLHGAPTPAAPVVEPVTAEYR